ncbi:glycosyl transferase family 11 domain-containing protein [Ditylenchus destructor]|nr:glycosyl transferase family 11 domain-containing protein [Ditylenchus destructor]
MPRYAEEWLYRFASIYGIGKALNRTPYYDTYYECIPRMYKEIQDTFLYYKKFLRLEHRWHNEKTVVEFGKHCCRYDSPERLKSINTRYLELTARHLQSYKYFWPILDEIRELFTFRKVLNQKVDSFRDQLFGNDKSHKLCVYTRRGDFTIQNVKSKSEFTAEATTYAASFLKKKFDNVSVVLLGQDKPFLRGLNLTNENISAVHIPDAMKRMEDLCFIARTCNSFIITAPHSTFGWWGAFLSSGGKNDRNDKNNGTNNTGGHVFYNSDFAGGDPQNYNLHDYSNFLPDWIPLRLVNNTIVVM